MGFTAGAGLAECAARFSGRNSFYGCRMVVCGHCVLLPEAASELHLLQAKA